MPWKAGESGNLKGRPKGSSNQQKLSAAYLRALNRDFNHHGAEAISRLREKHVDVYCRLISSILPRSLTVEKSVEHRFVINADPELTLNQWKRLHELPAEHKAQDIKHLEHVQ